MKISAKIIVYILVSTSFLGVVVFSNDLNKNNEPSEINVVNKEYENVFTKREFIQETVQTSEVSVVEDKKSNQNITQSEKIIATSINPMTPKQINYTYVEEEVFQVIPYETVTLNSLDLEKGKKIIKVAGVVGERKLVSQIKLANGKQVERKTISNTITVAPINEQVLSGSKIDDSFFANETVKMVNEINASRKDSGLPILTRNSRLDKAANVRLNEIMTSFSHTRPNGKQFYSVDSDVINGENIAYGMCDATLTHTRFMNSAGHRENILNSTYKSVGVAAIRPEGCPTYWVVLFGNN